MPLESADEVIAQIPKLRKPAKKKEAPQEVIVVCGSTSWTDRGKIKSVLAKIKPETIRYIVTGTSKGAELLAISVAKELKLAVVQVHPQQHFGNNAIFFRNNQVFSYFKPTRVIAFHKNIESSISSAMYLKLGARKGIPCLLVDGKAPKKKALAK